MIGKWKIEMVMRSHYFFSNGLHSNLKAQDRHQLHVALASVQETEDGASYMLDKLLIHSLNIKLDLLKILVGFTCALGLGLSCEHTM